MLFFSIGVLLTNAYRVYLRVNEDEGITTKSNGLLSHYKFRKAIALYWINDKEALNIYKSRAVTTTTTAGSGTASFQSPTSLSSMLVGDDYTIASSIGSKRAPTVDDTSLHENGKLKRRLDRLLGHFPLRATGQPYCSIHNWLGYRTEKQTMYCPDCNIHLCVDCYSPFHQCVDLVGAKSYLESLFKTNAKPAARKRRRM